MIDLSLVVSLVNRVKCIIKKRFILHARELKKKKRKYSNLVYDQHIHVSLILELWKVMEKIQSFDLSIFFVLYIRKDMTIVFARG